jgi:hypothetical protein
MPEEMDTMAGDLIVDPNAGEQERPRSALRMSADISTAERKRASRRTSAATSAEQRGATQRHLDARLARLTAYAAALEAALENRPASEHAETLFRQLTDARRDIARAARPRMAPARLSGLADPADGPARKGE